MSRAQRLLDLVQILRRHRRPVSGQSLAKELSISLRTLYRDIDTLRAQGAPIEGEAGLGFILRPGFLLPPLMLAEEEIEALVLGSRWVAEHGDARLGLAAQNALAKIEAVLPPDLRDGIEASPLLVGPGDPLLTEDGALATIREAIRRERKLGIAYIDRDENATLRTVWPFALTFFERARVFVAWCELRQDFRHFRTDRVASLTVSPERYPRRRLALLKEWRKTLDIAS
ncbi:MAG TPA: YafY family protein [Stellaceae bacterium]|nr:YafY family protein [Stellaceae bacterium]